MKKLLMPLTLPSLLLCGCSSTRSLTDIGAAAGGAYMAHELSGGSALATAAGAAGGVIVSKGLHYATKKQTAKAYAAGYDKGRSDAVKQQYWLAVAQQRTRSQPGRVRLYPVQLPEQTFDGVTFQPTTKYLRIEE